MIGGNRTCTVPRPSLVCRSSVPPSSSPRSMQHALPVDEEMRGGGKDGHHKRNMSTDHIEAFHIEQMYKTAHAASKLSVLNQIDIINPFHGQQLHRKPTARIQRVNPTSDGCYHQKNHDITNSSPYLFVSITCHRSTTQ